MLDYGVVDSKDYNLHLNLVELEGAARKGLDIYCALDDSKCNLVKKKVNALKKEVPVGGLVLLDFDPILGGA